MAEVDHAWPGWHRPGLGAQTRLILPAGLLILVGLLTMLGAELVQERDRADQQVQARQVKIDSLELTIAMVNQETGLRGYAYTAETVFLEPYTAGQAAAGLALQRLEAEALDGAYAAAVADVALRVGDWTAWAEARRAAVDRGGRAVDVVAETDGKARFDRLRAADDRLAAVASARLDSVTSAANASRERLWLALLVGGPPVVLSLLALGALLTFSTLRPLRRLAAVADGLAQGQPGVVPDTDRTDEVGSLARALERWQGAEKDKRERELLIRELSTPALPLKPGLLLLPIIGALDSDRAQGLTEQILAAIGRHRARVVVIDVTGVLAIDSAVANHLLRTMESCRLMGATVVLTGISAENAHTLVRIGMDLSGLMTAGDLRGGIQEADRLLGSPAGRPATVNGRRPQT
jgi:anti-anti-sigma regulatory factor/CHASE3 domain sensor protein